MAAVSTISTMKVERPWAMSSEAPTREKTRSMTPMRALSAGTKLPICARMAISAFWRRKVDLPPMFGPVTSQSAPPRQVGVVGDEGLALGLDVGLDHRMAAARDGEIERIDRSAGRQKLRVGGEMREAGGDVELGQRIGERAQRVGLAQRRGDQPGEDRGFDLERLFVGAGDAALELGQFARW